MTRETRTTVQLSDFKAVEFECVQCHARIVRPMGVWHFSLDECPECGTDWTHYNKTMAVLMNISSYIAKIAEIDEPAKQSPFIVRFEIASQERKGQQ